MSRENTIRDVMLILLGIFLFVIIIQGIEGCKTCSMYGVMWNDTEVSYGVDGYYIKGKGFYCVWVQNKTSKQIASTAEHEKCHVLVDKSYNHFCKWEN